MADSYWSNLSLTNPTTWFGGMTGNAMNALDANKNLINKRANELGFVDTSNPKVNKMSMFPPWMGAATSTLLGPTAASLYGIGSMAQNKFKNWMGNYNLANENNLGLENYITLDGTTPVINEGQLLADTNNITMPDGVAPLSKKGVNEDIHLDVGPQRPTIIPNIPKPGANWPGFGIPRALAETVFRMKEGPYYSEKFPGREFTEGGKTYTQSSLGGYYHPDEVFNMQQFGGVGTGDPRKDKWGKNIVSFADDYEEGLEDWVNKYGDMKYTTDRMKLKQKEKIAAWNQIQNRRKAIEDANKAASAQHLASQGIQVGGGGRWEDPGQRGRGGDGAFREDVQSMRSAGRSYKDAQGNVGYSRGRKDGGRVGLRMGGDPTQWMSEQETITPFQLQQEEGVDMGLQASDDVNTRILENLFEKYLDLGFSPAEAEKLAMEEFESMAQGPQEEIVEEGIASLV